MNNLNNIHWQSVGRATTLTGLVAAVLGVMLLIWFGSLRNPHPAYADEAKFYLECPRTWVREGESVDVFLVRNTDHQHNVGFYAYWHTYGGTADGIFDFVDQDGVRHDASDREIRSNRMRHEVQTKDGIVLEGEEKFTVSFTPTANVLNMNDPARDNQCEITVIDDDLYITGIEMITVPALDDTYGLGETIAFTVSFSHQVEVQGNVVMGLWVGDQWRGARYLWGSGSNSLVFGYEVQPDDADSNGISVHDGYVEENGTRHGIGGDGSIIEPGSGAHASPWYRGIWGQSGHNVDGSRVPRPKTLILQNPADSSTYRAGEEIVFDIMFTAPVRAFDTPLASLWFDGTGEAQWRGANTRAAAARIS